jgi:aspartate kinase
VNPCSDYLDRYKLAIVGSARSGSTKALGTTNLLLRAASEALQRPARVLSPVQSGAATPLTDSLICRSSRTGSPPVPLSAFAEPCTVSFSKTVDLIQSEHIIAARDCVKGKTLLAELEAEIVRDCESLRAFLSAAQVRRLREPFICETG